MMAQQVKAGRHSAADDAMRRVVEKMNEADKDTVSPVRLRKGPSRLRSSYGPLGGITLRR